MRRIALITLCFSITATGCNDGTTPMATERCQPDALSELFAAIPDGTGDIRFSAIEDASSFTAVGPDRGGAFTARNGDFLVETDRIRVVIQQPSRQFFIGTFGGTPIDADVVREDGTWHDVLGEITHFIGLNWAIDTEQIETIVQRDGVLVIAARGPLRLLDYLNLPGALEVVASNLVPGSTSWRLNVPWALDDDPQLTATNYYVFRNGQATFDMISAVCNPTDREQWTVSADLIDSGGDVSPFDTASRIDGEPGFGLQLSLDGLNDTPSGIIGYMGNDSGYAILPHGTHAFIGYAGIGIVGHGMPSVVDVLTRALLGIDTTRPPAGFIRLAPGAATTVQRTIALGRSYTELIQALRQDATGTLQGTLLFGGDGLEGARVAILDDSGGLVGVESTSASGTFSAALAPGDYTVVAEFPGGRRGIQGAVTVRAGEVANLTLNETAPARLAFQVRGTDPTIASGTVRLPAKVSLICDGDCPLSPTRLFADTLYDLLPRELLLQAYVDHEDKVSLFARRGQYRADELLVPAGRYRLVISHGPEFTVFEQDVTLAAGDTRTITAWLERVVDTGGWISTDTHVHAVNSPDSPVPLIDRVLAFAAENVEIMISTDHDYITDFRPVIGALGIGAYLTSYPGEELTFLDLGHFNGYPLEPDDGALQGGALDGAGGNGPTLTPAQLFSGLRDLGVEGIDPIVQVNHPRSFVFGFFSAIGLDTGTLATTAPPERFRMNPDAVTPSEGNTGLYSDDFDAFEVYNGYSEIAAGLNDLFAFLNIGRAKTGVAVSDTHQWYSSEAGTPRSYVAVPAGTDSAGLVGMADYVRGVRQGRVIGTNGPFLELTAQASGDVATIGELLDTDTAVLTVRAQMPDWITIDTLEIYANTPGTWTRAGDTPNRWPQPLYQRRIAATDVIASGRSRTVTWSIPITATSDTWVVAVARDDPDYGTDHPMFPVVVNRNELPFAFTNPLFLDANGNGTFDAPGVLGDPQTGNARIALAPATDDSREARASRIVRTMLKGPHHH